MKAWLKNLQNPYASLALLDEEEVTQPTLEAKQVYFRKLQNPHAYDAVFGDTEDQGDPRNSDERATTVPFSVDRSLSKRDFHEGCRRILLQYLPPDEGRVLRPHQRDFILRNEDTTPNNRFRILEKLRKYDLSTAGPFKPHFNRGEELFTERKLKQIEREE